MKLENQKRDIFQLNLLELKQKNMAYRYGMELIHENRQVHPD
jgi:hypothetical protein